MTRLLFICLAGALGTGTRYLVGLGAGRLLGTAFPFGTLIVNLVGCFLIAAVTHVALTTELISPTLRFTLTTGFMGGLTTYSSFNLETTQLLQGRAWYTAAVNFGATVGGCFVAGLLGVFVASRVWGVR
jgi:fluoride exporter